MFPTGRGANASLFSHSLRQLTARNRPSYLPRKPALIGQPIPFELRRNGKVPISV
jgi:hypothetical protein